MLVDIEERRRKIRVSPIFPKYFPNISEMFPGGFLSPGRFIAPGIFHHELLRWGNGKEVHFSSTYHHLFDTCLHVLTITPISWNLKITAVCNRATLAYLASAEP